MDIGQRTLFKWLEFNEPALLALSEKRKPAFLELVRAHFPPTSMDDELLFHKISSWIQSPWCPGNITYAMRSFKEAREQERTRKRHFIRDSGLHVSDADRQAFLDAIRTIVVKPLQKPHPPYKKIISESPNIYKKWYKYFARGKQADERLSRLPIHKLDPATLVADIGPEENIRLETPSGDLVGLVIRNFCPSEEATAWADAIVHAQVPFRRNIRVGFSTFCNFLFTHLLQKEDTGILMQLGWSAGQRSKRAFHWVRNITSKSADTAKLNQDGADLFAFTWQRMRSVVPTEVIDDFNSFIEDNGLPRMNPDDPLTTLPPLEKGSIRNEHPVGKYTVTILDDQFEFHSVELAPPGGVLGENYSR